MVLALLAGVVLTVGLVVPRPVASAPAGVDDAVHLNQVQVIGSHNSYHLAASASETALRRQFIGAADDDLQYTHAPLDQQFSHQKVRQIELDLFADADGGRYATPLIRSATGGGPHDPAMEEPGTKVLHVQDVDYRSNCLSLVACLTTVKEWSDDNPSHLPIAILLEFKDSPLVLGDFDFVEPEPFDAAAFQTVDDEIRGVFGEDSIISPDDLRGTHPTVEAGVLNNGWPTLAASRGQVIFLMDNGGGYRTTYLEGHPNLEGRPIFTNAGPGQPDAAFVKMNDAKTDAAAIADLVEAGYLVRTRADADTHEARAEDTTTREAALASGAQWVSTDYPVPEYAQAFGSDYVAEIPGGTVARCNPVNAPPECRDAPLDTIYSPAPRPVPTLPPTTVIAPPVPPTPPATPVAGTARFTG